MTKVECINNDNWPDYLTVGKVYEAQDTDVNFHTKPPTPSSRWKLKEDDLGNGFHYSKSYFKEI